MNSNEKTTQNNVIVAIAGRDTGMYIVTRVCQWLAPSIKSSFLKFLGMALKNSTA